MIPKKTKEILEKQHYALVGGHSAVQICRWAKKSLTNTDICYKEKFYGIPCHCCCQMSPAVMWCQNSCLHCWRAIELTIGQKIKRIDEPKEIIDGCIEAQRKLLSGFGGNKLVYKEKFKQAQNPKQFAISLSGEPTIYHKIGALIAELRKRKITSFLVTNGLFPEKLLELKKNKQLPTQLYLSLNTPNENLYNKWHRSKLKNAWKVFNQSLEIFPKLPTRKVIRMTLVRDINMIEPENYAKLIKKAQPDFVEVKGFMSVGFARQRLGYERMPSHNEIKQFAKLMLKYLPGHNLLDEKIESRVVLLGKSKARMKINEREI